MSLSRLLWYFKLKQRSCQWQLNKCFLDSNYRNQNNIFLHTFLSFLHKAAKISKIKKFSYSCIEVTKGSIKSGSHHFWGFCFQCKNSKVTISRISTTLFTIYLEIHKTRNFWVFASWKRAKKNCYGFCSMSVLHFCSYRRAQHHHAISIVGLNNYHVDPKKTNIIGAAKQCYFAVIDYKIDAVAREDFPCCINSVLAPTPRHGETEE